MNRNGPEHSTQMLRSQESQDPVCHADAPLKRIRMTSPSAMSSQIMTRRFLQGEWWPDYEQPETVQPGWSHAL